MQVRGPSAEVTQRDRAASDGSLALFRTTLQTILRVASDSERAILFDDGTQHSLDSLQLEAVLRDLRQFAGQPLDLLGMDACLMAILEVAYQVREHVRCLVASEELVPATSWPYGNIVAQLRAHPEMSAADLSKIIVQFYSDFYTAHPPPAGGGDVTKIALDLAHILV